MSNKALTFQVNIDRLVEALRKAPAARCGSCERIVQFDGGVYIGTCSCGHKVSTLAGAAGMEPGFLAQVLMEVVEALIDIDAEEKAPYPPGAFPGPRKGTA